MRFFDQSCAALAAVVFLSSATAAPQSSYESVTSATQVVTITRTVSRVVQTEYATLSSSSSSSISSYVITTTVPVTTHVAPTGYLPSTYGSSNGTSSSIPVYSASSSAPQLPVYTGAAGKLGVHSLGAAAIAGLVGFMAI